MMSNKFAEKWIKNIDEIINLKKPIGVNSNDRFWGKTGRGLFNRITTARGFADLIT